jgi:hypothetical protein
VPHIADTLAPSTASTPASSTVGTSAPSTTGTSTPFTTEIVGAPAPTQSTTVAPTTAEPTCEIPSALVNDRFISEPEFSTPIIGSVSDLNFGDKGVDFVVNTSSTVVTIVLPLEENIIITNLIKFQILRPSNVNRFRLIFLDKQNQPIGQDQILSTDSKQLSTSPTVDKFPIETNLFKTIQSLKIEILDTDDNQSPKQVTILFQACFKQTEIPTTSKRISCV